MSHRPTAVVTGATNGIGQATAVSLAKKGYDIGIVCRSKAKGDATKALIEAAAPEADVTVLLADYCDLGSVRAVAPEIAAAFPVLDALVNNAGINATDQTFTVDGHDEMLQVNYLAPFLLTSELLPHLQDQERCRIVNVASEGHRLCGPIDETFPSTTPKPYGGRMGGAGAFVHYGRTKLADIMWTKELARRIDGTRLTANCLCPGMVHTGIVDDKPVLRPLSAAFLRTGIVRTPERGAQMSVWLAAAPEANELNGRFLTSTAPAKVLPPRRVTGDNALQARLFDATAALLALAG